jgi:replicative DNA helicase
MSAELALRIPPNASEAEQALLGALLLDNVAWERVADVINRSRLLPRHSPGYLRAH